MLFVRRFGSYKQLAVCNYRLSTYYDSTGPSSSYRVQDNYISKGALTSYYDKDYYQFTTSSNYS